MFEIQYFIIGIVQGLTEFLPISSSGHLVLISKITNWEDQGLFTDVAVHCGTLIAVILYLKKELLLLLRKLMTLNLKENMFIVKVVIATLPSVFLGYFIYDIVSEYFRNLKLVAISSIIFAILLFVADRMKYNEQKWISISYKNAFIVGMFQILAFIPGASRAGVTITGARFLGLNRSNAAIFSMLLSIPIILASVFLSSIHLLNSEISQTNLVQPLFSAFVACITALLSINIMMKLIKKGNFNLFIIYRILLGFLLLYFYA